MKVAVIQHLEQKWMQTSEEIIELAKAANYTVAYKMLFYAELPHPDQYIPEQKVEELREIIENEDIKKIIIDDQLKPKQAFYLENELELDVLDKPMIILEIFENKANSKDIKLQVQLAQLKYSVPRMVTEMGEAVRSERPGFGGGGEQITDIMVSDLHRRIRTLESRLEKYKDKSATQRKDKHPKLPIIGYYSSGKTTLFNILTESSRKIGDEAFTTMFLKTKRSNITGYAIDFIDTVGIVDLPHDILSAFDLMLSSIFSYSGMILCLDSSLPQGQLERQLEDFQVYINKFKEDNKFRVIVALTKIDMVSDNILGELERMIHSKEWLKNYEILKTSTDNPQKVRTRFIEAFEILFSDELVEFHYNNLSPAMASLIHDFARVDDQIWHENGTTTLTGIAPKTVLNEHKGEIFE